MAKNEAFKFSRARYRATAIVEKLDIGRPKLAATSDY